MSSLTQGGTRTLRVNQIDACRLDDDIIELFRQDISSALRLLPGDFSSRSAPEVSAALRLLRWFFTTYRNRPTPGAILQNVLYECPEEKLRKSGCFRLLDVAEENLMKSQKVWLLVLTVILPLLYERLKMFIAQRVTESEEEGDAVTAKRRLYRKIEVILLFIGKAWQISMLANLLLFLRYGRYRNVAERICGIRMKHYDTTLRRHLSFALMNRQLYWQSITDFLLATLPLLDLRSIRRKVSRGVVSAQRWLTRKIPLPIAATELLNENESRCILCGASNPCCPHVASCGHVYCYYCISTECPDSVIVEAGCSTRTVRCPACSEPMQKLIRKTW